MATQSRSGQVKLGLFVIITLSISAGGLAMAAFAGWRHGDSSYVLQGIGATLLIGVVLLHARNLSRLSA